MLYKKEGRPELYLTPSGDKQSEGRPTKTRCRRKSESVTRGWGRTRLVDILTVLQHPPVILILTGTVEGIGDIRRPLTSRR